MGSSVILSEAKEAISGHGLLRSAQDDTNRLMMTMTGSA